MKRLLYITVIAFIALSCNKFLDVKPAGKLIPPPGDISSFDRLLNNTSTIDWVYQNNNRSSSLVFLTDDVEITNNQADYAWYDGHPNIDNYFAFIFKKPYGNPNVQDYYWNWGFYRQAQYFNTCIEGVNSVRTADVSKGADEIIAQATIARAWSYFYATMGYGPVYKPGGDNSKKTIPYRTSSDVMSKMEDLSTQEEVFQKVLADIHANLKNTPEQVPSNTCFGKVQAYAFLAYYHLFTQKFDSVAVYADKALTMAANQKGGMRNLFYDYNLFKWADAKVATNPDQRNTSSINTSEGLDPITATYNREICLYRPSASAGGTSYYPSQEYLALFDRTTDLRCEYFFFEHLGYKTTVSGTVYDDGRRIINSQTKIATTSGFTFPEILLMRAEANARLGKTSQALADLNYLRALRHKTGTPALTIIDKDQLTNEIIKERRRELPVGSPKRFFDLKRLCLDSGKPWSKTEIVHYVKGTPHRASIDSDFFILPIRNEILRWNPHWNIPLDTSPWSNSK